MTRKLGRWVEGRAAPPDDTPGVPDGLRAAVAAGDWSVARRLVLATLEGGTVDGELVALARWAALGDGGRAGGHRLAGLLGRWPDVAVGLTVAELRALVPSADWTETAAGLRLGLGALDKLSGELLRVAARLLHALPRTDAELAELEHQAKRQASGRAVHAWLDGLAATERWAEGATAAEAEARGQRRADVRVGLLDRAASFAWRAEDPVQAGILAGRALVLAPRPWRAFALWGRPVDGSLDTALDALYEDTEPVAAECQVILELGAGHLDLALARAEGAVRWAAPGDPLQWVLPVLIAWGGGLHTAPSSALDALWEEVDGRLGPRRHILALESPPLGLPAVVAAHRAARPALALEAQWCRASAMGLIIARVDAGMHRHADSGVLATVLGAWFAQASSDTPPEVLARMARDLAARHPRHRTLAAIVGGALARIAEETG